MKSLIIFNFFFILALPLFAYTNSEISFPTPKDRIENIGMFGSDVMLTWDNKFKKDPGAIFVKKMKSLKPIKDYKKFIKEMVLSSKKQKPYAIENEKIIYTKNKKTIVYSVYKTGNQKSLRLNFVALIPKSEIEYYFFYYKDVPRYFDSGVNDLKKALYSFEFLK